MKTLTLKQATQIQGKTYEEAVRALYNVDINAVPLNELHKYQIPARAGDTKIQDTYEIQGKTYRVEKDITKVTYAQFVDFVAYQKKNDVAGLCSCFLIPVEHSYNDGYDMQEVKEAIGGCDFYVISDYAFFFKQQSQIFASLFLTYSTQTMKKMKKEATGKEAEAVLNFWQLLSRTCKKLLRLSTKQ